METPDFMSKYREYLSRESKYAHIKSPMTFQEWKSNFIEVSTNFSNGVA